MPAISVSKLIVNAGLALLLSSLPFAAGAQTAGITPPADTPPVVSAPSIEQTISVNPGATTRDSSVAVTVRSAPVDATTVIVYLDGLPLPAKKTQTKDTYDVFIPGANASSSTSPSQLIPLGKHQVAVSFDKRWFTGNATLTILNPTNLVPVLTDVQEQQLTSNPGQDRLSLTGNHFIETPPEDNQIVIGGVVVPVKWDGCPDPADQSAVNVPTPVAHGKVLSTSRIQLCNLRLPAKLPLDVMVRQGETSSNAMQIYVMPLSSTSIVALSLAVVIAATVLVIFLASFLRKYAVNNKVKYGMFRILYLDPETNTYSLSKYQFYMWTAAALFSYTYLVLSRVFVQGGAMPDVPGSLPGIIGISAGTAIGAQLITATRGPKGGGSELPSLGDFVTSGGVAAPERVQMFVWTNLGALLFCVVVLHDAPWHISNLPTLGNGLMYLMGASSAGYLGGKLARKPGPVISEVSVSPDTGGSGPVTTVLPGAGPQTLSGGIIGDFSQPVASAQQANRDAQTAIAAVPATSSTAAFAAAQNALKALRDGISAGTAPGPNLLSVLADSASAADAGSQLAAAEYAKLLDAALDSPQNPQLANVRILAEQAQRCAAAAQDLASGVSQAAGTVQAAALAQAAAPAGTPGSRTIELRGRNLSMDATFEINNEELPFRMLAGDGGVRAPKMVAPEEDPNQAKLARELRLVIDPASLGQADKISYTKWFGAGNKSLLLAITNPDGQRSEISFDLPPGSQQSRG